VDVVHLPFDGEGDGLARPAVALVGACGAIVVEEAVQVSAVHEQRAAIQDSNPVAVTVSVRTVADRQEFGSLIVGLAGNWIYAGG